ncbi:MAG: ribulose-phosphate 3-epimerase [Clostridiales bacterium]|nr:ribulose-phosphate 3-epimerase [Clostridiales bacterium]
MIKIAPSILAADFSKLGEEILKIENAGADYVHIDVMDGHFVPNITIGPPVIAKLRNITRLPFDTHLMIENPDFYIEEFVNAGSDIITVHAEASSHLDRIIQKIHQLGIRAGVSLNPATPLSVLDWILDEVDIVLIMTVHPGFGGQVFISSMVRKVLELSLMIEQRGLSIDIEVDGGIDTSNIYEITRAGANVIVAGSAVYKAQDTVGIIRELRENAFQRNDTK